MQLSIRAETLYKHNNALFNRASMKELFYVQVLSI